ncbi:MAG TPA: hypothetical protein VH589_30540 [Trebonia sp.]
MHANAAVSVERGVPYGLGKLADIYWPDSGSGPAGGPAPTVLLWHGAGPDERYALAPLAVAAAGHGLTVVVPDWRSDAPDGGGAHLLASLAFTRERAGSPGGLGEEAIVLAGWSRGGRSAAAVGVRPDAVGGWQPLGTEDVVVDIAASREFAALLAEKGWPVRFEEQPVDHAGIIGAEYDQAAGRVRPATSPSTVAAGEQSARMIAEAAGITA